MSVDSPGDLIAAVPAMLGFVPERSLVLLCLGGVSGRRVVALMRHDLQRSATGAWAMTGVLRHLSGVCRRRGFRDVAAIIVDDEWVGACEKYGKDDAVGSYIRLLDELGEYLGEVGSRLRGAHVTAAAAHGSPWLDLSSCAGTGGTVADPFASAVAVAHVLEGRAIRGSRAELEKSLEPIPAERRERLAELIDELRDRALVDRQLDLPGVCRLELVNVLTTVARLEPTTRLGEHEVARLGMAIALVPVRDSLFALSLGGLAAHAEQLWSMLAVRLPDFERAEAASLLALSAYVRGDGPLAGVALAAALQADPAHELARLLDDALQEGMAPSEVRHIAQSGYTCGQSLGVVMPR